MIWGSVEVAPASTEEFLPPVPRVGGKFRLQIPCSVLEEKKTMGVIANLGHVHVSNWLPRTSIETQFACLAAQERGHWRKSSAKVVCSCLVYRWKLRQCPPVPTSAMALFSSALTIAHPRAQRPSSSPAWPQRCPSARNARGKSAAGPRSLRLHRGSILTWPNHSLEPIRFPSSCGLQKCMPRGHEGLCP